MPKSSLITIGVFDGVHLGHQFLLQKALGIAREENLQPVVLTFEKNPREILFSDTKVPQILSKSAKVEILTRLGFEVRFLDFAKIRNYTPAEFIHFLQQQYNLKVIVVGKDFRFGKDRSGGSTWLRAHQQVYQYKFVEVARQAFYDQQVSSSLIRESLSQGKLELVRKLLGSSFEFFEAEFFDLQKE